MHQQTSLETVIGFAVAQDRDSGGMFQYSEAMLDALDELAKRILLSPPTLIERGGSRPRTDRVWIPLEPPSLRRTTRDRVRSFMPSGLLAGLRGPLSRRTQPEDTPIINRSVERWLSDHGIELLIFPAPDRLVFEAGLPAVMAIHDLQHRLQPEFPEVSRGGQWEVREFLYRNAADRALLLLVDSEVGKEDVMRFYGSYGATEDRIEVLPFIPSPGLRLDIDQEEARAVVARYGLPERFLVYPAQFWPHKNHLRLVEALARLPRDVHLVLCGARSGRLRQQTFKAVFRRAHELEVANRIHYLGYVTDLELSALYDRAVALIFPTFFGPTNIPIVEAWNYGLPVVTSRVRGITEQTGDAAILVDPKSVDEMAAGMEVVWGDSIERTRLAEAGRARLALYTPEDHRRRLLEILTKADQLLR